MDKLIYDKELDKISLRLVPDISSERGISFDQTLLLELADVSEPKTLEVDKGQNIIGILKSEYSEALPSMWPILVKSNQHIDLLNSEKGIPDNLIANEKFLLVLPPGPKLVTKTIPIKKGDTLSEIVNRNIGTIDPDKINLLCKKVIKGISDCEKIYADTSISVPVIAPITVKLNAQVNDSKTLEELKGVLKNENLRKSRIKRSNQWQIRNETSLASAGQCDDEYDYLTNNVESSIRQTIIENKKFMEFMGKDNRLVTVVVADSGLATNEVNYSRLKFVSNTEIGRDINLPFESSFPKATGQKDSEMYHHGTHVAGIIFNASNQLPELTNFLFQNVRMLMFKITNSTNGFIDDDIIFKAINTAYHSSADIINMSIESQDNQAQFEHVKNYKKMLFVFSSGNEQHQNISDGSISGQIREKWPLMFGGSRSNYVLVVGAHGKNEHISSFSNSGSQFVDLGAPGKCIPSYKAGEESVKIMTGTSQAAPLVSMVASILHSYRVTNIPGIKYRIISAVDFQIELLSHYYSSGNLNINKSIRIFDDIVELKDGSLKYGVITSQSISIDGKNYVIDGLMKFKPYISAKGRKVARLVFSRRTNTYSEFNYGIEDKELLDEELKKVVSLLQLDGSVVDIPISDISDIVFMNHKQRPTKKKYVCEKSRSIDKTCQNL